MLSCLSVLHTCSNFSERYNALDAHTTNFHSSDISRFPIFGSSFFQMSNEPKTMKILNENFSESRNSWSIKVNGVGVEDMMLLRKIGTLV